MSRTSRNFQNSSNQFIDEWVAKTDFVLGPTPDSYTAWQRRLGKFFELQFKATFGSSIDSTGVIFDLTYTPQNEELLIDTNMPTDSGLLVYGMGSYVVAGTDVRYPLRAGSIVAFTPNKLQIYCIDPTFTGSYDGQFKPMAYNDPFTIAEGDIIYFHARVPIEGW